MHPSQRLAFAAAVSAMVGLAACASMNVSSYVQRGMQISEYRTYNWGPADSFSTGDPRLDNNRFFQDRVQAEVDRQLAGRGFEQIASGTPDLLLHYHASVTQQVEPNAIDRKYGYCDTCEPYVYDAGTLVIDLVDARTNKLVWRGWAEGSIDGAVDNQGSMEQRIDRAVARILEQLPRNL
jgi:hypothetical protein